MSKGFTIIELLICIVILAIIAILVSNFYIEYSSTKMNEAVEKVIEEKTQSGELKKL